ncbi:MAG TPA: hypothetical protein VMT46_19630 [Anaerolineaceae bacterium]|nr:hypothetical protein [Anaerolineaceae bacterium]
MDSSYTLTHGSPLSAMGALANLNPIQGVYTGYCLDGKGNPPLIGQLRYALGAKAAHLAFLAPVERFNTNTLSDLLEHLATKAGEWGAFHLLAEVDDQTKAFEGMRQAGFSIFAWQRIWKFKAVQVPLGSTDRRTWQVARDADQIAVRSLYQSLVPALVQPSESMGEKGLQGMVCRTEEGEITAFADLIYGPRGIWVQPFVHPSSDHVTTLLADLICSLPRRGGRPVYLCIRSYQGWLEAAMEDLNVEVGPRQALMIKHLAITQRAVQPALIPALEKGRAEPSAPIANIDQKGP